MASEEELAAEREKSGQWTRLKRHYFDGAGVTISSRPVRLAHPDGGVVWVDEETLRVLVGEPIILKEAASWSVSTHWVDNETHELMLTRPQLVESPAIVRHCRGKLLDGLGGGRAPASSQAACDDGTRRRRLTSTPGGDVPHDLDRPLWRSVHTGEIVMTDPIAVFATPKSAGPCACCGPKCQRTEEEIGEEEGVKKTEETVGSAVVNYDKNGRKILFVPSSTRFADDNADVLSVSVDVEGDAQPDNAGGEVKVVVLSGSPPSEMVVRELEQSIVAQRPAEKVEDILRGVVVAEEAEAPMPAVDVAEAGSPPLSDDVASPKTSKARTVD